MTHRRFPHPIDVLAGVAFAAILVVGSEEAADGERLEPLAYVLCVVSGLSFVLRAGAPAVVFLTTMAAIAVWTALDYPGGPIYLSAMGGTALLVLSTPMRTALTIAAGTLAGIVVLSLVTGTYQSHMGIVYPAWLVGAALLAEAHRARGKWFDALHAQAIAEERLRIARDVHDIVGHSLATISLQAGVATHLFDDAPDKARGALATIRQVSRQSLSELSAMLGMLRGEQEAEREPARGLDAVDDLVATLREAGMDIDADVAVTGTLPEVVGVTGYRIVQEALTNVVRHAGPGARATVRVAQSNGSVEVEVRDDGRGAGPGVVEGSGILGMRERAEAVGGRVETGDAPGGGFRVHARLPAAGRTS